MTEAGYNPSKLRTPSWTWVKKHENNRISVLFLFYLIQLQARGPKARAPGRAREIRAYRYSNLPKTPFFGNPFFGA